MEKDILIESNDLMFVNNDLVLGESLDQSVYLVLASHKGNFVKNRELGMGLSKYLNRKVRKSELEGDARRELVRAGYSDIKVDVSEKGIDWYEIQSSTAANSI